MDSHRKILIDVFAKLGSDESIRLFKNPVGLALSGKIYKLTDVQCWKIRQACKLRSDIPFKLIIGPHEIKYGLTPGSADLIGFKKVKITPDMVGKEVAQFLSIEIKPEGANVKPNQNNWMIFIKRFGGLAGIAWSVLDAFKIAEVQDD